MELRYINKHKFFYVSATDTVPLVGGGGDAYGQPKKWSAIRPASLSPLKNAPWTVAG